MKTFHFAQLLILLILAGCGTPKQIVSYQQNAEAEALQGNYTQAVEAWKQHFVQQPAEQIEGAVYAKAAQTAFLAGEEDLATGWFDQARYKNFADADMYFTLAKIYQSQNNLSKELSALEFYTEHFNENKEIVYARLFDIYIEIESVDKALNAWEKTNDSFKNETARQKTFFLIHKKLGNNTVCDSLSAVILEKEPQNVEALEWNAQKYYWLGENRYQQEMEKYNQNKTTKQYRVLLNELELVTADLKKALPYFEKLWAMNPGEKYAGYLANIYARFGDEKKSDSYKKYLK